MNWIFFLNVKSILIIILPNALFKFQSLIFIGRLWIVITKWKNPLLENKPAKMTGNPYLQQPDFSHQILYDLSVNIWFKKKSQ